MVGICVSGHRVVPYKASPGPALYFILLSVSYHIHTNNALSILIQNPNAQSTQAQEDFNPQEMLASTKQPRQKMVSQTHPPVGAGKKKALKGANKSRQVSA